MDSYSTSLLAGPMHLRTYRTADAAAVASVQVDGRPLIGPVPPTPLTPDEAAADYFAHPPNHLWVAEADGLVVGVAGLKHEQPMIARLTLLCIDPEWDEAGVAEQLIRTAVRHCHYFGYLKLVAETAGSVDGLIELFGRCGLRFTRHRGDLDEPACLLEFYVDLYRHRGFASPDAIAATAEENQVVTAH